VTDVERRPARPRAVHHILAYGCSLPERMIRGLVGVLGGLGLILARLLPRPVREGKFYRIAVERQLKMMTDDVGRAGLFPGEDALDSRTATRMGIGGTIDNLLILGLHASPIWVLLAATDLTKEAKWFTGELAAELKEAGVMKEGSRLDSVDAVLQGLSTLSARCADTLDKPPISLEEMKSTVGAIRQDLGDVTETAVTRTADIEGLARDIRSLAKNDEKSLLEVTSAVAVGTMRTTGNLVKGTIIGAGSTVKIVGKRLWSDVLLDYGDAVKTIHRRGFYGSLSTFLNPHARGTGRLFAYDFLTFTEMGLSLLRWRKADWRYTSK
jgi:hypothetical protein